MLTTERGRTGPEHSQHVCCRVNNSCGGPGNLPLIPANEGNGLRTKEGVEGGGQTPLAPSHDIVNNLFEVIFMQNKFKHGEKNPELATTLVFICSLLPFIHSL